MNILLLPDLITKANEYSNLKTPLPMVAWAYLQELLKSFSSHVRSDDKLLDEVVKNIRESLPRGYREYLNYQKSLSDKDPTFFILEREIDTYHLRIAYFLEDVRKWPILLKMAENDLMLEKLRGTETTLTTTFFEDIVTETEYDDGLLRLMLGLVKIEINKLTSFGQRLFVDDGFFVRLLRQYTKRYEYTVYMKSVYRDILKEFLTKTAGDDIDEENKDLSDILDYEKNSIEADLSIVDDIEESQPSEPSNADPKKLRRFQFFLRRFRDILFTKLSKMPFGIRAVCRQIFESLKAKFPETEDSKVIEAIFSNLLYPFLLAPDTKKIFHQDFDLISVNITNDNYVKLLPILLSKKKIHEGLFPIKQDVLKFRYALQSFFKALVNIEIRDFQKDFEDNKDKQFMSFCTPLEDIFKLADAVIGAKADPEFAKAFEKPLKKAEEIFKNSNSILASVGVGGKEEPRKTGANTYFCYINIESNQFFFSDELNKQDDLSKSDEKDLVGTASNLKAFLKNIDDINPNAVTSLMDLIDLYKDNQYSSNRLVNSTMFRIQPLKDGLLSLDQKLNTKNSGYSPLYNLIFNDFQTLYNKYRKQYWKGKFCLTKILEKFDRKKIFFEKLNQETKEIKIRLEIREFLEKMPFAYCVDSPTIARHLWNKSSTRLFAVREIKECNHIKHIEDKMKENYDITSERQKLDLNVYEEMQKYHSTTLKSFLGILQRREELKEALRTGQDDYGIRDMMNKIYMLIHQAVEKKNFTLPENARKNFIAIEIESYVTQSLYPHIFPSQKKSWPDIYFFQTCKLFKEMKHNVSKLKLDDNIARYLNECLTELDKKVTPYQKSNCMKLIHQIVHQNLSIIKNEVEPGDYYDNFIQLFLYSTPPRMVTNFTYVELFENKGLEMDRDQCCVNFKAAYVLLLGVKEKLFEELKNFDFESYVTQKARNMTQLFS